MKSFIPSTDILILELQKFMFIFFLRAKYKYMKTMYMKLVTYSQYSIPTSP